MLRFFEQDPRILLNEVHYYRTLIEQFYHAPYGRDEKDRKKRDIEKAFQHIFKKPIPKLLVFGDRNTDRRERNKDLTAIAVTFLSYTTNIPFEALRDFYYSSSRTFSEHQKKQEELTKYIKKSLAEYRRQKPLLS
jgi:hypothetical protein